ncbi:putative F-box domain, leucine-rich repeat domain, L domain-containing protein [Medicago truncatula]|uniref:Putative F-box domain, leucine-rich repeat domain, L domain-containing protein n=1 Tax=Medicago truncatula TaxID=3880 RepID=A0A396GC37_MEDTR|nr:putative F-box domain, leucine-rich repeat domain, L domain-containing protein [Medicago truncatula]
MTQPTSKLLHLATILWMFCQKKKVTETEEEEDGSMAETKEDMISSLPDCVLSHILSFLPIKNSIATSLLSRRWRYIWKKHLSVLDFSDDSFELTEERSELLEHFQTFAAFVNNVFYNRMSSIIRKMRLSCTKSLIQEEICTDSINRWVSYGIGPHLLELDLTLFSMDVYQFKFPISLSSCPNLVSLR